MRLKPDPTYRAYDHRMSGCRPTRIVLPGVQVRSLVVVVCLLRCAGASAQAVDAPPPPSRPSPPPDVNVDALPLSLDRIAERLEQPPALRLDTTRPTFRVQIYGQRQRWLGDIDWLGTADGRRPPVGVPWHDQFLNMVTPEQARSFGAFEGTDLLQVMATSFLQGFATETVVGAIKGAIRDRRERQAKEEVDAAIAAWKKEREAAALRERATQEPARGGSDVNAGSPP
jgi:hypothetical protein